MVQRAMGGPSCRSTASATSDGRCLNAIPRTMLESRGGESIKGQVIHDEELIELGRTVMERLRVRGPPRSRCSATPTSASRSPT